ncbi:putative dihydrouridine synthase (Dus) [Trypanosoma conorhini]|uniref:tRNA-dihydrouridine(16/17) synthase [NAD(P)(+)] n=1 Tax=Trypanosoma conorhini TaxID=83891 RepID=A0A3R7KFU0_9TRYP|nr:putative dihydrouridine synthase (Dus) [Trypanosoma conorhini]RNF06934.1 putative dihydrouridine synthase (Dus) [Trypanosoma conorhini]
MAYNEALLGKYRELVRRGEPFRSATCPYCNGTRDASIQHIDPKRKPQSPWDFWDHIVCAPSAEKNDGGGDAHDGVGDAGAALSAEQRPRAPPRRRPMYVVGPMVDQSELPFRMLCRRYGATLAYSPMLHARSFAQSAQYRARYFSTTPHRATPAGGAGAEAAVGIEEAKDHPLFVQFCGNDPDTLLAAARYVEDHCEAVDINFGCPQGIARRGHYGSFLMEDWELVHNILHCLAVELRVPVTAKMRVFDDEALTLKYAEMLRDTGIAVLCVHGRTRHNTRALADISKIRRVRDHLRGSIPVIGNGNVLTFADVLRHLSATGCEGYMCAEPLLWDPRLFSAPPHPVRNGRCFAECREARLGAVRAAQAYLQLVQRYPVDVGFVKAHLFKMLFHSYEMHPALHAWLTSFSCSGRGAAPGSDESGADGAAAEAAAAGESSDFFTAAMAALGEHLRRLYAAEVSCGVEGPQPKRAEARQQGGCGDAAPTRNAAAAAPPDAFAEDEVFGIDFD